MKGLYVCYNEIGNGPFDEAIKFANEGYLIWRHPSPCKQELKFPSKILIKISGKLIYYLGTLLLVRNDTDFNPEIFINDHKHRPVLWRKPSDKTKSVFFITNLEEIEEPLFVKNKHPPQGITYIEFED